MAISREIIVVPFLSALMYRFDAASGLSSSAMAVSLGEKCVLHHVGRVEPRMQPIIEPELDHPAQAVDATAPRDLLGLVHDFCTSHRPSEENPILPTAPAPIASTCDGRRTPRLRRLLLTHLCVCLEQEFPGPLEHFVPAFANAFDRRPDLDVRNEAHALELTAVGMADVVAAEGDDDRGRGNW
jgi:hypothetical protein